jgi:hypothetical protein
MIPQSCRFFFWICCQAAWLLQRCLANKRRMISLMFVQICGRLSAGGFAANPHPSHAQQVSPVLCGACARQKTHGAVCHSFAVGSGETHTHAHEAKRFTALPSGGLGVANSMRMKLSGLPLCQAGDWGLQTPCA